MRLRFTLALLLSPWAVACADVKSAALSAVARDIERLESVREVKDVQRSLAHLAQFGRWNELGALFSSDGKLVWGTGSPLDEKQVESATGPDAIASWFRKDAGNMDGARPGSLHTLFVDQPVVSLSSDGLSAKGRWHTWRLMGDGAGATRIQGGEYENEYVLDRDSNRWRISLLRYYPLFAGDYKSGWQNVGSGNRTLPLIPYHFTPDEAGIPIPQNGVDGRQTANGNLSLEDLAYRAQQLNDEDEVRNLQHAYGYYVDRRMWPDVVDLFSPNGSLRLDNTTYLGKSGILQWLQKMGPEGLTTGILNEHILFDTVIEVGSGGSNATSRGIELGLIGDTTKRTSSWEFGVFRNQFVKDSDTGIWMIEAMEITRQIVANYSDGWGNGGTLSPKSAIVPPSFLSPYRRGTRSQRPKEWIPAWPSVLNGTDARVSDVGRRLARSAAYDETENISGAYGYFADDIRCDKFAALHAQKGFKESPGTGWYFGPKRIAQACLSRYNTVDPNPKRPRIPFHWRLQPVIQVSQDGRSTSFRSHNIQLGTANQLGDSFNGVKGGGMYHDQFVLEDFGNGTSRRKLWSLTIDEFYWQAATWSGGWANAGSKSTTGRKSLDRRQGGRGGGGGGGLSDYPPDLSLKDPKMGEREIGFSGGSGKAVSWPEIQRMWFAYRNPVTGRVPQSYWAAPACVPCKGAKPEWALTANGYQEPATGPTLVTASVVNGTVIATVTGGLEELVSGIVELRLRGALEPGLAAEESSLLGYASVTKGSAALSIPSSVANRTGLGLLVMFLGNDNISSGQTVVKL